MAAWTPLDPTNVDLTDFDVSEIARGARRATDALTSRAATVARDTAYVTVGLGLLNFQRLQVRRRELERAVRR